MPPTLRQCATTAITAVYATSTMFAMAAMLGRLVAQLKMPRLDAYLRVAATYLRCVRWAIDYGCAASTRRVATELMPSTACGIGLVTLDAGRLLSCLVGVPVDARPPPLPDALTHALACRVRCIDQWFLLV